jgi:peptidoglycan/LPS O-acetylase OafA/YrhL
LMLSGFVIAASYGRRLEEGLSVWRFLVARVRRLAPVYWGGMALCTAAALLSPHPSSLAVVRTAVMGIFLIPVIGPGTFAYPVNFVAWTLAWELIVNIAYAAGLRRLRGGWLMAVIVLPLIAAFVFAGINPRNWAFGITGLDLWMGGLRALPEYLFGTLLYRAWRAGHFRRLPLVTPLLPLAAWLAIAVVPPNVPPLFDLAAVVFVCPLLIGLLLRGDARAPGWFLPLGAISYPLYASHLAWIGLAQHTPLFGLNHDPDPLRAVGVVLLAVASAWVLYRTVDPARKGPKPAKIAALATPEPVGSISG